VPRRGRALTWRLVNRIGRGRVSEFENLAYGHGVIKKNMFCDVLRNLFWRTTSMLRKGLSKPEKIQ